MLGEYFTLTNLQLACVTWTKQRFPQRKNLATTNTGVKNYHCEYTDFRHHSLPLQKLTWIHAIYLLYEFQESTILHVHVFSDILALIAASVNFIPRVCPGHIPALRKMEHRSSATNTKGTQPHFVLTAAPASSWEKWQHCCWQNGQCHNTDSSTGRKSIYPLLTGRDVCYVSSYLNRVHSLLIWSHW